MKYLIIIVMAMLFACHTAPLPVNKSLAEAVKPVAENDTSSDWKNERLEDIVHDFVSKSTDTFHIDTFFSFNKAAYELKATYYCLFDSALIVPYSYVSMYGMDQFITNNYVTAIMLLKDEAVILDTIIAKEDYAGVAGGDNIGYRLLNAPVVYINADSVVVAHSLSVPLSDVGQEVTYLVLKKG